MNTTTTPGFTAAASLYNTSRHYRTSYRVLDRHRNTVGAIRLAEINVPGEVIEIEDDAPWSQPSWGGHTGPGTTSPPPETGGGEPGGGGADGGTPSDTKPKDETDLHGCDSGQINSPAARPCMDKHESDLMNGVKHPHYLQCTVEKKNGVEHRKIECCQKVGKRTICDAL